MEAKTLQFKVVGDHLMHCGGCANSVEIGLMQLRGVRRVTADHKAQTIEVQTDPQEPDVGAVMGQLDLLGYRVEEMGRAG